jgi:hypothetical protein
MHALRRESGDSRVRSGDEPSGGGAEGAPRRAPAPRAHAQGAARTVPIVGHRRNHCGTVRLGDRFGSRLVIAVEGHRLIVRCDCGQENRIERAVLVRGNAHACRNCERGGHNIKDPAFDLPYTEDTECQIAVQHYRRHHGRGMSLVEIAKFNGTSAECERQAYVRGVRKIVDAARRNPKLRDCVEHLLHRLCTERGTETLAELYHSLEGDDE